jgi:hypothetical protein
MGRRYGEVDFFNIDELAVEFACNGTVMPLNRDEITVAAQRMAGKCSSSEIARRCRTDDRTIVRILHALGAKQCPVCCQLVFQPDGVVADHIDYRWRDQCAGSNRRVDDVLEVAS